MEEIIQLSIIIVNYKNQDLITQCVQSIIDFEKTLNYEIIVVDNNSDDNSETLLEKICPELVWVQMGYNSGFGRANNVGMQKAKGKYLLLLNSDILLTENNVLFDCFNYLNQLDNNKQTILGIRLTNIDGRYQETLRLSFPTIKKHIRANPLYIFVFDRLLKKNKKIIEKELQKNAHLKSGEVSWINGAFLLMDRKTVLEKDLLFDKDFFLYGEYVEWCWRAKKKNMNFMHWHEKELIHIGSASMPDVCLKRCQITVSDWMMIKKTRGVIYFTITLIIELINLITDDCLHYFAELRNIKLSTTAKHEAKFRKMNWYLMHKYAFFILFHKKLSTTTKFYTNCYEDSFLKNTK